MMALALRAAGRSRPGGVLLMSNRLWAVLLLADLAGAMIALPTAAVAQQWPAPPPPAKNLDRLPSMRQPTPPPADELTTKQIQPTPEPQAAQEPPAAQEAAPLPPAAPAKN